MVRERTNRAIQNLSRALSVVAASENGILVFLIPITLWNEAVSFLKVSDKSRFSADRNYFFTFQRLQTTQSVLLILGPWVGHVSVYTASLVLAPRAAQPVFMHLYLVPYWS